MQSLFKRVTRYSEGLAVDPGENRLTESFATVLTEIPLLAAALVQRWDGTRPQGDVQIRTQRPTASGGFVDLELSTAGADRTLIWVEVKHGTQPYAEQLRRYLHDIEAEPAARRRVQLLVPALADPVSVTGVDTDHWENLGGWIRQWAHAQRSLLQGHEAWIIKEFMKFLKEEGLEDIVGLRSIHVVTMAHAPEADAAFRGLRERVDAILKRDFGEQTASGAADGGRRFFSHYRPRDIAATDLLNMLRGGWLEWKFLGDSLLPISRGEGVFGAGYTSHKKAAPSGEASVQWRADLERDGFVLGIDDQWRLYRFWYPEQLLQQETLDAQAELLAGWVAAAFNRVLRDPVPA